MLVITLLGRITVVQQLNITQESLESQPHPVPCGGESWSGEGHDQQLPVHPAPTEEGETSATEPRGLETFLPSFPEDFLTSGSG